MSDDGCTSPDLDSLRTEQDVLEELNRLRIRAARHRGKVRLSLLDLEAASGVPKSSLANYLTGRTLMPAEVLDRLVLALGVEPARAGAWATMWERVMKDRLHASTRSATRRRGDDQDVDDFGQDRSRRAADVRREIHAIGQRPLWRPSPVTFVALVTAFAMVGSLAAGTVQINAPWWPPLVWTAAGLLAAASVIGGMAARRHMPTYEQQSVDLNAVVDRVGSAVGEQWRHEERQRRVTDPVAIPVRWRTADSHIMDHQINIWTCGTKSEDPPALDGELGNIVDAYRRVPSGRLVILGKAGAGKTVLAARLALNLLDDRDTGAPVPVIVNIGSWNPTIIDLPDWLATELICDFPGLNGTHDGLSLAAALVTTGRILPILDGFDEMSAGLRTTALHQLNIATGMPLVLTSRTDEYASAVRDADVLTAAAGITLVDLTTTELGDYLPRTTRRSGASGDALWEPVLVCLRRETQGTALRAALTTPLMVYLIRMMYSDTPDLDPAELTDTERFPDADAVEDHLFAGYLPALYRRRPSSGRQRDLEQAQDRLAYLAWHLDTLHIRDIAWWQLRDTVPRAARVLVAGIIFGLPGGVALGLVSGPVVGLVFGCALCLMSGLVAGLNPNGPLPAGVYLRIRGIRRNSRGQIRLSLAFGLVGCISGSLFGLRFGLGGGLLSGLVFSLIFGLLAGLQSGAPRTHGVHIQITRGLASALALGLGFGVLFGLLFGFVEYTGGIAFGLTSGILFGLVLGPLFAVALGHGNGLESAWQVRLAITAVPSVQHSLTIDRANTVRKVLTGILIAGLMVGFPLVLVSSNVSGALLVGLVYMFTGGLINGLTSAWGQWVVLTKPWLTITGRLPLRGRDFLADAYNRGALRQTGAVYQFRHARLQEHLARHHAYTSTRSRTNGS